jgi:DNA-binding MarR family transcriptional regulator
MGQNVSADDILQQARFIFSTGKLIRDRVLRTFTGAHNTFAGRTFGELTLPQVHLINTMRTNGQMTISQLAEMLQVSPPSASTMVDRLVEKGILRRTGDPNDRRKVVVSISEQADINLEQIESRVLQSFVDLCHQIGPEMTAKWCEVLARVKEVQDLNIQVTPSPREIRAKK